MAYWSNGELEQLKDHYPELLKPELQALFPNRTYQAIQRMASYLGIKRTIPFHHSNESKAKMSIAHFGRKLSEEHRISLRRCSLDESIFDTLTESSAYWTGFLIADGNISYKRGIPIIALHLKEADLHHLEKFRSFINSSHKIGSYVNKIWGNKSYSISFSSNRIANDLVKYGCVPRKCFKAKIQGKIQNDRHLWRGIIDGDGSLGVYKKKTDCRIVRCIPYLSLTGSYNICIQFKTFLEKKIGPMPKKIIPIKRSNLFMISNLRAINAIKLLYKDCTVALDRKLIHAEQMIGIFGDRYSM